MINSIDLIPADYRDAIARQRLVRVVLYSIATVIAVVAISAAGLGHASRLLSAETERLRTQSALSAQQREQLDVLEARLADLDEEWTLLQGLRSGAAGEDLFVIVDRALPGGDVWFVNWRFRRAGVIAPRTPRTVSTGYFIVVAADTQEAPQAWQVKTHMNINGQARDHAALSRFVRGLYEQPEIQDVKVNNTQVRRYVNNSVVDFDLAIILHVKPAAQS